MSEIPSSPRSSRLKDDPEIFFAHSIPEHTLWKRVLERAIRDALQGDRMADIWLHKGASAKVIGSMLWTCTTLGLDVVEVRRRIRCADGEERERMIKVLT